MSEKQRIAEALHTLVELVAVPVLAGIANRFTGSQQDKREALISAAEVAELLDYSEQHVRRLAREGVLPRIQDEPPRWLRSRVMEHKESK